MRPRCCSVLIRGTGSADYVYESEVNSQDRVKECGQEQKPFALSE